MHLQEYPKTFECDPKTCGSDKWHLNKVKHLFKNVLTCICQQAMCNVDRHITDG